MMSGKGGKKRTEAPPEAEDPEELPELADAAGAAEPAAKKARKGKAKAGNASSGPQTFENGVLRALVVENFMNHKHLRVDLDPHVNFIVGKNGSGKSAIVNALIAGFGHKASSTGRNTNKASSLIMHGKSYALIQMHIANGGEDAYNPEEFGDTIVAEHRLERTGGGSYKLKNGIDDDKGRKSSRVEFEKLCTHLNIQANNPCALLTQEHAKKFLHYGNEEDRYKFFLQAANMDSRKTDLNSTRESVELFQARLGRAQDAMKDKREIAEAAQREYDGAKKLKMLEDKLLEFEPLLGWALVGEKERELTTLEEQLAEAAAKEAEAKSEAESKHNEQQRMEEAVADLEKRLGKAQNDVQKIATDGERTKTKATSVQKALKKARKQVVELTDNIKVSQADVDAADEEFQRHLQMLESTKDAKQAERMRRLQQLTERIEAGEQQIMQQRDVVAEKKIAYEDGIKEARAARGEADDAEKAAQEKAAELKSLKTQSFNRIAALHPDMPQLLDLIQAETRKKAFKKAPLGPLGLNVSVKDEYKPLGAAIELAIHPQFILGFIVFSGADEVHLRKLMNGLRQKNPRVRPLKDLARVAIRQEQPRFATKARRSSGAGSGAPVTLIETLDLTAKTAAENDAWHNFLLDNCTAEHKLVFRDEQEAEKVVYNVTLDRCESIACAAYNVPGRKIFKRFTTTGSEGVPPCRNLIVTDKNAAISSAQTEVNALQDEHARLATKLRDADALRKQLEQAEKDARKAQKDMEAKLKDQRDELEKLEAVHANDAAMGELDHARNQVQKYKDEVTKLERHLAAAQAEVEAKEEEFQPLKEKVAAGAGKYQELMVLTDDLGDQLEKARAPLQKSKARRSTMAKTLLAAQTQQQDLAKKSTSLRANLELVVPQVEGVYGERVHDPQARTVDQLKAEKRTLEAKIKTQEARHGGKSLSHLAAEAAAAKEVFEANSKEIAIVEEGLMNSRKAFEDRHKFFRKECKAKGKQAANDFNARLSRKGHAGKLEFDHDNETLKLSVTRNSQDENSASTSDARNLSGGERSFTTLSFELAMWEFCATPFRVLDEFDVYMDDTYRKQAVDTLMELCDAQTQRQFLFVTPQDMFPFLRHREESGKSMPRITRMEDVR